MGSRKKSKNKKRKNNSTRSNTVRYNKNSNTSRTNTSNSNTRYSSSVRAKLYGENIFEFEIPCKEVLFLSFEEYKKTPQGKSSTFETFIKD